MRGFNSFSAMLLRINRPFYQELRQRYRSFTYIVCLMRWHFIRYGFKVLEKDNVAECIFYANTTGIALVEIPRNRSHLF